MLRAAIKYSYVNAKTRTMHSKRLRPSDWHVIEDVKDSQGFIQYLATTFYGPWISPLIQNRKVGPLSFETRIFKSLFHDYHKIHHGLSSQTSKELILALFSRFEGENLKIVLRAIFSGLKKTDVAHLLYPVEEFSKMRLEGLWTQKGIKGIVKLLETTPFGPLLHHALPQFEAQGRLFPLEMAIDISCYRRIATTTEALRGKKDRKEAKKILGSFIDMLNISHIARLRFIYGLSPEEALNYSYPGGNKLHLKELHAIAKAGSPASMLKLLPEPLKTIAKAWGQQDLATIRIGLEEWVLGEIRRAFLGNPFHLGVPIAHLLGKELEIRCLVRLYQAKIQKMSRPATEIVPSLFLKGGEQIVQAS